MTKPQGRPEFEPTTKQRRSVSIAAGAGESHEEIAIGIGIAINTLRKHFALELTRGAYERRQEVIEALFGAAVDKGNAAAAKAYLAMTPQVAAPPLPPDQPVVPEGKKAQANAAAVTAQAGTEWESLLTGQPVQ
ncbi:MAG: hypothetical protein NUV34_00705 [Sulfuricaulis sp.]|nr:hypothetical protein [Sulfuricaulis sp.]